MGGGLSQARPQALPCSTAFTGSPLLSPRPQCAAPTALPPALRPVEAAPRQAPTSTGQTQGGRTSSAGSSPSLALWVPTMPSRGPCGSWSPWLPRLDAWLPECPGQAAATQEPASPTAVGAVPQGPRKARSPQRGQLGMPESRAFQTPFSCPPGVTERKGWPPSPLPDALSAS